MRASKNLTALKALLLQVFTAVAPWVPATCMVMALIALIIVQSPVSITIVLLLLGTFASGGFRWATVTSLLMFDVALDIRGFENKGDVILASIYPSLLTPPLFWPEKILGREIYWAPGYLTVFALIIVGLMLQLLAARLWRRWAE